MTFTKSISQADPEDRAMATAHATFPDDCLKMCADVHKFEEEEKLGRDKCRSIPDSDRLTHRLPTGAWKVAKP